jgi:Arc/MetJ-type ribon-helix-helix transcriptional regulator
MSLRNGYNQTLRGRDGMGMTSVQVRMSDEQLALIDRKVEEGRYPNRSEAIRDYLRKAQLWEVLERVLDLGDVKGQDDKRIKADLARIRQKVYQQTIAPKRRQRQAR